MAVGRRQQLPQDLPGAAIDLESGCRPEVRDRSGRDRSPRSTAGRELDLIA